MENKSRAGRLAPFAGNNVKKHCKLLISLLLIAATTAVYYQVYRFDFAFDDHIYITENNHIKSGLTAENIIWAFTDGTLVSNYWHPLTWLSHLADIQLYGLNAGGHHLTSLIVHILNTLLLFFVFENMTAKLWPSALVAALFALHPLHVESVAWIAERKDVLSTFFWLLTMWAYGRYAQQPKITLYMAVIFVFAAGLMSKPMLVTLPFVLLMMDVWPLGRLRMGQRISAGHIKVQPSSALVLIMEKIPLLALSAIASTAAYITQRKGGAVPAMEFGLLKTQAAHAVVSYVSYIGKMIWPAGLAAYYPDTGMLPAYKVAAAALLLAGLSVLFSRWWRKYPYLAFGWFWFLGTFVPVIGFVKIGNFAMADRFTYVPLTGLFIMAAWGLFDMAASWRHKNILLPTLSVALVLPFAAAAWKQTGYWKNDITLFTHALAVTADNDVSHNNLGSALEKQGRIKEAVSHYLKALQTNPDYEKAHFNLAVTLAKQGRTKEAIEHYQKALRINPVDAKAHYNLGNLLITKGRIDEAFQHYLSVIRIKPDHADSHNNLGNALFMQGRTAEAVEQYLKAIQLSPDHADAHSNLGFALEKQGRINEAVQHYFKALQIDPDHAETHRKLGNVLYKQGRIAEAAEHYLKALRITPDDETLHINLGAAFLKQNRTAEAIDQYLKALKINPDNADAHYNLAAAFVRSRNIKKAIYHFKKVLTITPGDVGAQENLKRLLRIQQQQ